MIIGTYLKINIYIRKNLFRRMELSHILLNYYFTKRYGNQLYNIISFESECKKDQHIFSQRRNKYPFYVSQKLIQNIKLKRNIFCEYKDLFTRFYN